MGTWGNLGEIARPPGRAGTRALLSTLAITRRIKNIMRTPALPRRLLCLWLPRLASDRVLRGLAPDVRALPFAVVARAGNADRLACLTAAAEAEGLARGMALADARALCPGLVTRPADPLAEAAFLRGLARWGTRFSPRVGCDGADGLVLDITGVAHLFGGEGALVADLMAALARLGVAAQPGLAGSRGAAWALARFGARRAAAPGGEAAALATLPPAALRLPDPTLAALDRLGLRRIADIAALPRAGLARRLGAEVLLRLDQATGAAPEAIAPEPEPPVLSVRLTLPEPIGLVADVMAGLARLLDRLCARLADAGLGARRLRLTLRRVDGGAAEVDIGLARPLRDAARITALFAQGVEAVEAGFGIDMLRLQAMAVEPLAAQQLRLAGKPGGEALADLLTRLGNRIGFEALWRLAPAASHIPEKSFLRLAAAFADAAPGWPTPGPPRPLLLFAPEPVAGAGEGATPPARFRWRRMEFATTRALGPERIAPEWWLDDPAWRSGLRDYWQIETRQGRRLWLYHTPQNPGWFAQGEFA